ncbi:MAG: hypothetical protein IPG81_09185 [Sandaracinaceae bacterium]|jgi:hypothetical protein|nr:hypothetical protein [Sandaracinaceae bacterium]MBK7153482.1 hypothetical protein [Sandaracinaceae bacterium]MBK8587576.1 hypothetical protein [Sandaracinaceae bacterium]MBP7680603.1 hypothetical protein [Deltaproteobacteria bacterium]
MSTRLPSLLLRLGLLLACSTPVVASADACDEGNLLRGHPVLRSGHVVGDPLAATDGWLLPDGRGPTRSDSVRLGPGARLRVELGNAASVVAVYVQGDARATLLVEAAGADGRFTPLFTAAPVEGGGERGRGALLPERTLQSLRVTNTTNAEVSLSEVGIYACERALADAARWTRATPDLDTARARTQRVGWAKVAFGLLALLLLLGVAPGLSPRRAQALHLALCLAACGAWLDFGTFAANPRGPLHLWDSVHYFLGSKYVREVGFTKLYDCMGASAERRGRAEIFERGVMRRLEDNVRVPGSAIRREAARCTTFTEARARELDADLTALGQLGLPFGMPIEAFANDRGYMATPFGAALHHAVTAGTAPSHGFFLTFALIDGLCLILAVVVLGLGLGLRPATFVAVALAVGAPWDYYWLGGAFDRHTWLLLFAGAMVTIHRGHAKTAGVLLATLVLHRAFPAGFALGALLFAWLPRPDNASGGPPAGPRMLAAFTVTLLSGIALGALVAGPAAWLEFADRLRVHVHTPVANELGLGAGLRLMGGDLDTVFDPGQLDGLLPWQQAVHTLDHARAPLRWLGALAALLLLVRAARLRRPALEGAFAGALLLLCVSNIASYYGGFIVLVAALPGLSCKGRSLVVAAALGTQVFALLPGLGALDVYALTSLALLSALALPQVRTLTLAQPGSIPADKGSS